MQTIRELFFSWVKAHVTEGSKSENELRITIAKFWIYPEAAPNMHVE